MKIYVQVIAETSVDPVVAMETSADDGEALNALDAIQGNLVKATALDAMRFQNFFADHVKRLLINKKLPDTKCISGNSMLIKATLTPAKESPFRDMFRIIYETVDYPESLIKDQPSGEQKPVN